MATILFKGYSSVDKKIGSTQLFDLNLAKQDLNGFEPNRAYKILIKVNHNDNQTIIYDDDFEFILRV